MSESSLRLLEAAPAPTVVLEVFAERIRSSSWTGNGINVMESRADVIRKLVEHERADIAAAVQSVSAKLIELIKDEKEREQRRDREHEQRFE